MMYCMTYCLRVLLYDVLHDVLFAWFQLSYIRHCCLLCAAQMECYTCCVLYGWRAARVVCCTDDVLHVLCAAQVACCTCINNKVISLFGACWSDNDRVLCERQYRHRQDCVLIERQY